MGLTLAWHNGLTILLGLHFRCKLLDVRSMQTGQIYSGTFSRMSNSVTLDGIHRALGLFNQMPNELENYGICIGLQRLVGCQTD